MCRGVSPYLTALDSGRILMFPLSAVRFFMSTWRSGFLFGLFVVVSKSSRNG
jgi:hypothetical protein